MINDNIEIFDAKIVNFKVDYDITIESSYDNDDVLFAAYTKMREYFSDKMYIGEPLYITKIYEVLNSVDGVIATNKVDITGITGGRYSSIFMNFEEAMSRDGTFIKTPKNVILELRYAELDIKGTVR